MSYPSSPPPSEGTNPYEGLEGAAPEPPAFPTPIPPAAPVGFPASGPFAPPPPPPPPPPGMAVPPVPPVPAPPGAAAQPWNTPNQATSAAAPWQQAPSVYNTAPSLYGQYAPTFTSSEANGSGTAALVLGIIGFLTCAGGPLAVVLGILAVIFGVRGRQAVDQGRASNRGAATAGLILGITAIVLGLLVFIGRYVSTFSYN